MNNLYQTQLLALARDIRGLPEISGSTNTVTLKNPVCGDTVRLSICYEGSVVVARHIDVEGCALCAAGAGYWYKASLGASANGLRALKAEMASFLNEDTQNPSDAIAAFEAVKSIKNRHKCVLLALEASAKLADTLDATL